MSQQMRLPDSLWGLATWAKAARVSCARAGLGTDFDQACVELENALLGAESGAGALVIIRRLVVTAKAGGSHE